MRTASLIFITLLGLMFLTACAKPAEKPSEGVKEQVVSSAADSAADIENDINDAGTLNSDLDSAELDSLDKELEEINW